MIIFFFWGGDLNLHYFQFIKAALGIPYFFSPEFREVEIEVYFNFSAKTPVSRVLSKSVGTPASELRAQMRSLIRRIKSIQEEYSLLENHYEELNKDYKELQEFTKFEKDFGVRDKWEKEQKLKIKDQV